MDPQFQSFLENLLSRIDLVTLIRKKVQLLRRVSQGYIGLCPFHKEKTASFSISQNKGLYHCFGCGKSGNAINFLMETEQLTFIEAVKNLAHSTGLSLPQRTTKGIDHEKLKHTQGINQILSTAAEYYAKNLSSNFQAQNYLKTRGLNTDSITQFKLGFASNAWQGLIAHLQAEGFSKEQMTTAGLIKIKDSNAYDLFRNRIMFPIHNRYNQIIAFGGRVIDNSLPKYINSPETILFSKRKELYGLHNALKHRVNSLIIVEGYMDVLALNQHGIKNAVASLGTAFGEEQIQLLFDLPGIQKLIFCFDRDTAGENAAWRLLKIALPFMHDHRQLEFLILPDKEDPDTFIRRHGSLEFERALGQAVPFFKLLLQNFALATSKQDITTMVQIRQEIISLIKLLPKGHYQHFIRSQLYPSKNKIHASGDQSAPLRPLGLIQSVMAILIKHPDLINNIEDQILIDLGPQAQPLITLKKLIHNSSSIDLEDIAKSLEIAKDKLENYLSRNQHLEEPKESLQAIMKALKRQILSRQINLLINKSTKGVLLDHEKLKLINLIKDSKLPINQ